jgi:endonuclease/exonuclease/phosphatase family metal-dependent hydrolase
MNSYFHYPIMSHDPKPESKPTFSMLTYNVWFGENYQQRIQRIVSEVKSKLPDIIGLQEVIQVANTATYLRKIGYKIIVSPSPRPYRELIAVNPKVFDVTTIKVVTFPGSVMGRELLIAGLKWKKNGIAIHVGVSHLESMFQYKQERLTQLSIVFRELRKFPNSFFLADTNLVMDAALKIPSGWTDTFHEAGTVKHKYTYSNKTNPHISSGRNTSKRYDRIFRHGEQFTIVKFELFGTNKPQSDHYGVLIECNMT